MNTIILGSTLKPSFVDEKYEDVLVNVNILDTEHTKKNFENIKSRAGYQAYDSENVDEVTGDYKFSMVYVMYDIGIWYIWYCNIVEVFLFLDSEDL